MEFLKRWSPPERRPNRLRRSARFSSGRENPDIPVDQSFESSNDRNILPAPTRESVSGSAGAPEKQSDMTSPTPAILQEFLRKILSHRRWRRDEASAAHTYRAPGPNDPAPMTT